MYEFIVHQQLGQTRINNCHGDEINVEASKF